MKEQDKESIVRIRSLSIDLKSKIVISPEEGHIEPEHKEKMTGGDYDHWDPVAGDSWVPEITVPETYVVDKPEVSIEDNPSRENARQELEKIYKTASSLKVIYLAGKTLGYSSKRIILDQLKR